MVDLAAASGKRAVSFGPFRLIPAQRLLLEGDKAVRLGSRALDILIALVERAERTEERYTMAELMRVRGELLLLQGAPDAAAVAEDHFRQALDWACRQGALSWELRAATSLARLLRERDRSGDARDLLAPIYDRFIEGFGTVDLQAAKRLIDALS